VGSKGGVEPLVHALRAQRLLTEFKILKLDFVNAFNEVERGAVIDEVRATYPVSELSLVTWVYGTPSDLLVTMDTFEVERVLSQRGVRQGCPLSPLLFSLVMRVILRQLAERMAPRIVAGLGLAPPSQQRGTG
jgi:Reverse transcriptase (RNA-dependent DNA polymerase)